MGVVVSAPPAVALLRVTCAPLPPAALLSTKTKLGEVSHLQGLYLAAREELDRLDKENGELKEMVQSGVYDVGRSRCDNERRIQQAHPLISHMT